MKIGIGVTTRYRPQYLETTLNHLQKFRPPQSSIVVVRDEDEWLRLGVAGAKNECLVALWDCDHIFLFDDDLYPVKKGWWDVYMEASLATGYSHFALNYGGSNSIKEYFRKGKIAVKSHTTSNGFMLYLNSEVKEKVGGFSTLYKIYGHEHLGWQWRIHNAGLTPAPFIDVKGSLSYFKGFDFTESKPVSTLSQDEKDKWEKINRPLLEKEKLSSERIDPFYCPYREYHGVPVAGPGEEDDKFRQWC